MRRELQRDIEEAEEQLERNTRALADVFIDYMESGDQVEVAVGPHRWLGLVVRVGAELIRFEASGRRVDIALDHLTAVRVVAPRSAAGCAYAPSEPLTLPARLRELCGASAGLVVEIAGAEMTPVVCTVAAVSTSHAELTTTDGEAWVVPIRAIGFVMTTPSG